MKIIKKLFEENMPTEFGSDIVMFLDLKERENQLFLKKIYCKKSRFEKFISMIDENRNEAVSNKYLPRFICREQKLLNNDIFEKINVPVEELYKIAFYHDKKSYILDKNYKPLNQLNNYDENFFETDDEISFFDKGKIFLKLYRCGQASISSLHKNGKVIALFDLGSKHKTNPQITRLFNILNKTTEPVLIIISHFDTDHIDLYKKLNYKNPNLYFLFHQCRLKQKSVPYKLFMTEIRNNNCKVKFINKKLDFGMITVEPCQIAVEVKLSIENQTSLFSVVRANSSVLYMPGDAMYPNFPIHDKPTHILLPHHGSYWEFLKNTNGVKSFVYAGHNKRYQHPRYEHISLYENTYRFDEGDNRKIFDANGEVTDDLCCILKSNSYKWVL